MRIRCPSGHWFNDPIEFLTYHTDPGSGQAPLSTSPAIATCARGTRPA